ncbi:MAG: hypothetical protein GX242_06320 [Clostridiales bacterium]|nr:hypothetical protein [Clostridiales bacterium]
MVQSARHGGAFGIYKQQDNRGSSNGSSVLRQDIKETLSQQGASYFNFKKTNNLDFYNKFKTAKENNKYGAYVE